MFAAIRSSRTLVLACVGLSLMALAIVLPRAARADNNATDITRDVVQVRVAYPDKDTQNMIELPISSDMLPPLAQQKLNTPLGQQIADSWSNIVIQNNETYQQITCDKIKSQIHSRDNSKYSAYDIDCNLASSGVLTGFVAREGKPITDPRQTWNVSSGYDPQALSLHEHLANNSITFSETTPYTCHDGGLFCTSDPRVTITFDLDVEFDFFFDSEPCYAVIAGYAAVSNAQLHPANATAGIILDAVDLVNGFLDALNYIGMIPHASVGDPQAPAASADNIFQYIPVPQGTPLDNLLGLLTNVCQAAADRGFSDMQMRIDPGALTLLFIHPPIGAPTLIDPNACPQPCLINNMPAITVAPQQAHPGDTLTVYGSGFNAQSSSSLKISWYHDPNVSGPIDHSDVRWGLQYGPQQTSTVKTDFYDKGAFTTPNTLQPGTAYQFSVRDCDQLTCSPWSSPLTLRTAAAGSNQVTLRLDDPSAGAQLGTLTVQPDGTLSGTASLPSSIVPGQHTLYAIQPLASSGQTYVTPLDLVGRALFPSTYPSATFTVVQARTTLQPVLQAFDSKNKPLMYPQCGGTIILHGDHFAPGGQVTITFNFYNEQGTLANAAVNSGGSFDTLLTLPNNLTECFNGGTVTLTANESTGSGTLQATIQLQIPAQPR